jgi:thioredoxin-related protein
MLTDAQPTKNMPQSGSGGLPRRSIMLLGLGAIATRTAVAAEDHTLVMVEDLGCVHCARWHAEVGGPYANSAEGRFAPLRRARIGAPEIAHIAGLRYTPTFVLLRGRTEIGRSTGYPGADFFWSLLGEQLAKTSFGAPATDEIKT